MVWGRSVCKSHLHVIRRRSSNFQVNPMKDVGGVADTRSLGRTDRRKDGRNNAHTNAGGSFL